MKSVNFLRVVLISAVLSAGLSSPARSGFFDLISVGGASSTKAPTMTAEQAVGSLDAYWSGLYGGVVLPTPVPMLGSEVLAKAPIDECFDGDYPRGGTKLGSTGTIQPNADGSCNQYQEGDDRYGITVMPKANESYVWGLARLGDRFWIGSGANVPCLVGGGIYLSLGYSPSPRISGTRSGMPQVCEYGYSPIVTSGDYPNVPAHYGDWRPPSVYVHDVSEGMTEDKTNLIVGDEHVARLNDTLGFRSAGALNDVVLMAGSTVAGEDGGDGVNVFAFRDSTGEFLGSTTLSGYNDIRKWLVVKGVLYCTVRTTAGKGAVLRWTGDAINPFNFTLVGNMDNMGAFMVEHGGLIYIATWPSLGTGSSVIPAVGGIYMSPKIPSTGLTSRNANSWKKVWAVDKYERDPAVQYVTLVGALASYNGYLYWGTMQMPTTGLAAAMALHNAGRINLDNDASGSIDNNELQAANLGTHRPTSVFRSKKPASANRNAELLYGLQYMPMYDKNAKAYTVKSDSAHKNKMGKVPKFGNAGFNVVSNVYTWTMGVVDGHLYIGTADTDGVGSPVTQPGNVVGADLYRFDDTISAPAVETLDGFGNPINFGIRTMIPILSTEGDPNINSSIFLGTGTEANLATEYYTSSAYPEGLVNFGGWEFRKLHQEE